MSLLEVFPGVPGYFVARQTCVSKAQICPVNYGDITFLPPTLQLVNPDPTYIPPTCGSGPLSVPCQKIDPSCPPGFAAIGCVQPIEPKNLGPSNSCLAKPSAGNPVDIGTGNKYKVESDYYSIDTSPLGLVRTYNASTIIQNGIFGANWRSNYERSIKLYEKANQTNAAVFRHDGKILYFAYANGLFTATGDIKDRLTLVKDAGGKATGFTYISVANDEVETYDVSGRLVGLTNRANVKQTLSYDARGWLSTITDSFGRTIQYTYALGGNLVSSMTDPAGGVTRYQYSGNKSVNLSTITYPDGKIRRYVYENVALPNALTGIIDENGKRFATWSYDAQGRALSSEHAGGAEKVSFTYGINSTQVTDALASVRTYNFETVLGVVRNKGQSQPGGSGCAAASNLVTYDVNGNIASQTDFNGNKTTYSYDLLRNLETSRTEAFGTLQARTISTQWHATLRLPTVITEPGKVTTLQYDTSGNLLQKTITANAQSRVWKYTYNSVGQVLTATGPRTDVADVTTYTYDLQGNLSTIKNAANHITTLSNYDANGRVGRITDANGVITDMTYSPRGWLTSKTFGGEITRYDYDGVGQMTKVTLPDLSFLSYTYDDAHRLTQVTDSLGNSITYTLDPMGNRIGEQVKDPIGTLSLKISRVYDALNRLQQITGGLQ